MLPLHPFLWLILVLVPSLLSIGLWVTSPLSGDGPIAQLSVLDTSPCAPYSLCSLLSYDLYPCEPQNSPLPVHLILFIPAQGLLRYSYPMYNVGQTALDCKE
jgi:hypothetical protein